MTPWEVLGVDPESVDEGSLKKAYASLLKSNRPDQNPDGFKRLRAAYETAVSLLEIKEENPELYTRITGEIASVSAPAQDDSAAAKQIDTAETPPPPQPPVMPEFSQPPVDLTTDAIMDRLSRDDFSEIPAALDEWHKRGELERIRTLARAILDNRHTLVSHARVGCALSLARILAITDPQTASQLLDYGFRNAKAASRSSILDTVERLIIVGNDMENCEEIDKRFWSEVIFGLREPDWNEPAIEAAVRRLDNDTSGPAIAFMKEYVPGKHIERILTRHAKFAELEEKYTEKSTGKFSGWPIFIFVIIAINLLKSCVNSSTSWQSYDQHFEPPRPAPIHNTVFTNYSGDSIDVQYAMKKLAQSERSSNKPIDINEFRTYLQTNRPAGSTVHGIVPNPNPIRTSPFLPPGQQRAPFHGPASQFDGNRTVP